MNLQQRPTFSAADVIAGLDDKCYVRPAPAWTPSMVPALSGSECEWRASMFTSLMYNRSRDHFEPMLRHREFNKLGLESAFKTLVCVSIHLTGIECGGVNNPEWFIKFLFHSLREADARYASPSARSVIQNFGSFNSPSMITLASTSALNEIGIQNAGLVNALTELILKDQNARTLTLRSCLMDDRRLLTAKCSKGFLSKLEATVL